MKCFIVPMMLALKAKDVHEATHLAWVASEEVNDLLLEKLGANLEIDQYIPNAEFAEGHSIESVLEVLDEDQIEKVREFLKVRLQEMGHDYL